MKNSQRKENFFYSQQQFEKNHRKELTHLEQKREDVSKN